MYLNIRLHHKVLPKFPLNFKHSLHFQQQNEKQAKTIHINIFIDKDKIRLRVFERKTNRNDTDDIPYLSNTEFELSGLYPIY